MMATLHHQQLFRGHLVVELLPPSVLPSHLDLQETRSWRNSCQLQKMVVCLRHLPYPPPCPQQHLLHLRHPNRQHHLSKHRRLQLQVTKTVVYFPSLPTHRISLNPCCFDFLTICCHHRLRRHRLSERERRERSSLGSLPASPQFRNR